MYWYIIWTSWIMYYYHTCNLLYLFAFVLSSHAWDGISEVSLPTVAKFQLDSSSPTQRKGTEAVKCI